MLRFIATTALVLATAAAASDGPRPEVAPLPPPRPEKLETGGSSGDESRPEVAPLQPPRPADLGPAHPPSDRGATRPGEPDPPSACLARIEALGIRLMPLPAISEGACGTTHPFRMKAASAAVSFPAEATVQCALAEALARWTTEAVAEEAQRHLGATLKTVQVGTSYQCRGRNRQDGALLSEHAFANAVDVAGFSFDKGPAIVVGATAPEGPATQFLAAVRKRACTYFTTVLGPGSDPFHHDHLHLDLRPRKGDGRMCQ